MKQIFKYFAFFLCYSVFAAITAKAQNWYPVGRPDFSDSAAVYTSIAIDKNGTPYVVYTGCDTATGNNGRATVMKYNGSSWVTVGSAGFSAGAVYNTSIAIDSSGTPYVVYNDGANGDKITVMKYNGSNWVTLGNAGFSLGAVAYPAIAIDPGGVPYVVYVDDIIDNPVVMKYNGTNWQTVGDANILSGHNFYEATTIAIDKSGTPYVVYGFGSVSMSCGAAVMVMMYKGNSWEAVGNLPFITADEPYTSIAIDSNGSPYVAYTGMGGGVTVTEYYDSNWVQVGDVSADVYGEVPIAIDKSGTPYIACQERNGYVMVNKYSGGSWDTVGRANISEGLGDYTSLAIDASGAPYVAYVAPDNGNVIYGNVTVMKFGLAPINGPDSLCIDSTTVLSDILTGGTWSSSNTAIATISSGAGVVTGIAQGTVIISYTLSDYLATLVVAVDTCLPSGLANGLSVFPDPTHGSFTLNISSPQNESATIIITNILGEKVKQLTTTTNQETQIQLDTPPGIYFISAATKNKTMTTKVVVR